MPAWRKVGVRGWAAYSRHADLENGLFLYPTLAIGGAVFTVAAAISFQFDVAVPTSMALPLYASVVLVLAGLLVTVKAAPIMMGVGRIGEDTSALQTAFDGFMRWGDLRGVFQVLAFFANVLALLVVLV